MCCQLASWPTIIAAILVLNLAAVAAVATVLA